MQRISSVGVTIRAREVDSHHQCSLGSSSNIINELRLECDVEGIKTQDSKIHVIFFHGVSEDELFFARLYFIDGKLSLTDFRVGAT